MIKKILQLLLFLFLFTTITEAQSNHNRGNGRHRIGVKGQKIAMPKFDKRTMMKEDSINEISKVGGMRFAKQFDVNLTPDNSGESITFADGSKIWTLEITSDSAYSINLIFSKFHLMDQDTLYIFNTNGGTVLALTKKNNLKSGILPLAPIDGSTLTLEFHQSNISSSLRSLEIGSVNHDYRGLRGLPYPNESTLSKDTCSLPVTCVPEIQQVKHSVCLLILNGSELCSGTLVNNTAQDGKPYLLTAAHCFDIGATGVDFTEANTVAPTIVAFFNYEMPNCDESIRGSQEFTIGGSTLKAFADDIDFALVELSTTPPVDFRPYYVGWNLTVTPTAPFRGIHHPYGKVKVMARENNALTTYSYPGLLANSHWKVAQWEIGTTQPGSSGSGLFDASFKLVGCLSGGASECISPVNDYYHRLNKSWDFYPESTKQLKAWLDPTSSGVTSFNGYNPYGNDSALRFSNFAITDTAQKAYLPGPATGLVGGQNSLGIQEYAERFTLTENAYLYGVYIIPCKANASQTGTNIVNIKVYAGDSVPNPSYLLDEKQIDLSTLQWVSDNFYSYDKIVLAKNENYIKFDAPIAVGDTFFIVYTVPYANLPADSFAVYSAQARGIGGLESALAYYGGQWTKMFDITGTRTSFWIDPVIHYDSTAVAVDTSLVERSSNTVIFPNPAHGTVYIMTRSDKSGDCIITLYSTFGQKISTTTGKVRYQAIPVSLQGLPPGVYVLRVAYSDKTETFKLIVK